MKNAMYKIVLVMLVLAMLIPNMGAAAESMKNNSQEGNPSSSQEPGVSVSDAVYGSYQEAEAQYIIKFKDPKEGKKKLDKLGKGKNKPAKEFKHSKLSKASLTETEVKELTTSGDVEYIELDQPIIKAGDTISSQLKQVHAPEALALPLNGEGVNVAILDTGVDLDSTEVSVKESVSFVDDEINPDDMNGHGTMVAGILAAAQDDKGLLGVAPKVNLYSLKVLNQNGYGQYSNVIEAIEWSIEHGIHIVAMSFTGAAESNALKDAIQLAHDNGILLISAAGNDGAASVGYPAKFDSVISVGSVDSKNQHSYFSNMGKVDLVAPGEQIQGLAVNDGSYVTGSGTSFAVSYVTGVAALLKQAKSELTNDQVRGILTAGATKLGNADQFGSGIVNAVRALQQVGVNIEETVEGDIEPNFPPGSTYDNDLFALYPPHELTEPLDEATFNALHPEVQDMQKVDPSEVMSIASADPSANNVIRSINAKTDEAPFSVNTGKEQISTVSGNFATQVTDLVLPGRNGMSFALTRIFDTSMASLYNTQVEPKVVCDCAISFLTTNWFEKMKKDNQGNFIESTRTTTYLNNSSWGYNYSTDTFMSDLQDAFKWSSYVQSLIPSLGKHFMQGEWQPVAGEPGYYQRYYQDIASDTYQLNLTVAYYINLRTIAYGLTEDEQRFPIGKGWTWDIPYIKTAEGKKYVNIGGNSIYEINGTQLKDYPWKDLSIGYDSSIVVDGVRATDALISNKGITYHFDEAGRLIRIADPYKNAIDFYYETHAKYGKVLKSIKDSIGNSIDITYTDKEVVLMQGTRKVTYHKGVYVNPQYRGMPIPQTTETLESVTDVGNRLTSYQYDLKDAYLTFTNEVANNPYMLLKMITYPTMASTVYEYHEPVLRFMTGSAFRQVYKTKARYEVADGKTYNRLDFKYFGDMDSLPSSLQTGSSLMFQTQVSNGQTTTTYSNRKVYTNDETPNAYYTDQIVKEGAGVKQTTSQTYNEAKRIPVPLTTTTVTSKDNQLSTPVVTSVSYDDYGNILTSTDPYQTTTTMTYDAKGLLDTISQPIDSQMTRFTDYTRNDKGIVTQIVVQELNGSTSRVLSDVKVDSIDPSNGNFLIVTQRDDNRNITKTTEYSSEYNYAFPTKETINTKDANGSVTPVSAQYQYDKTTGLPTKFIDGKGKETTYEYDLLGRMTKVINPDLSSQSVVYDDSQNKVKVTNETGLTMENHYNALGWLTEQGRLNSGGGFVLQGSRFYDQYGQVDYEKDASSRLTDYSYDAWGRLLQTTYGPSVSTVEYDDVNQTVKSTDPEGNVTKVKTDLLGRTIQQYEVKPMGEVLVSDLQYDKAGNVIQSVDSLNAKTTYKYDGLNRLVELTNALNEKTSYTYTLQGTLAQIKSADGSIKKMDYDEQGRVIIKTDATGNVEKLFYDLNGNLEKRVKADGTELKYSYNDRNLLQQRKSPNETISYTYDAAGRRDTMTDNTGLTDYQYNPETKWLESITYPNNRVMSYSYYSTGDRESLTDPFGQKQVYTYNKDRMLLDAVGTSSTSPEVSYTYDKNGRVSTATFKNGTRQTTQYDGLDLKSVIQEKVAGNVLLNRFDYTYDSNHNMKTRSNQVNGTTYTSQYDALNRIQTDSQFNAKFTYDLTGNRLSLETEQAPDLSSVEYKYDDWDRLVQVTKEDGTVIKYAYNGDDLLTSRTENGVTTTLYYDGSQVIAEGTITGGIESHKASYYRGLGLAARKAAGGAMAYYLTNGHGDTTELRGSNGEVLNRYDYDMWGNVISKSGNVDNPFQYSGEYYDEDTKLQYLRARWYDPSMGRFINKDTYEGDIANPLTLNLYTYTLNNPLIYIDPSGHEAEVYTGNMVGLMIDLAKAASSTSQAYWEIKSDLGEARDKCMLCDAAMPRNQFLYLFNLATMTVCNSDGSCRPATGSDEGYTNDTAAWAKKQLVEYFDIQSKMIGIEQGIVGAILSIEAAKITPTQVKGRPSAHLTTPQTTQLARYLGYKKIKETSHGQAVYYNGKNYITYDVDSHNGGTWKMAKSVEALGSNKTRMGTYDVFLVRVGD